MVDWGLQLIGGTASEVWADLKLIAAAGDAEDYVKLLLRGKTGITADIEINGAAAFPQIPWLLMGSCGSMTIDSKYRCRVRYFKPTKLAALKASGETPRGRGGSNFSGAEEIAWIEGDFRARRGTGRVLERAVLGNARQGEISDHTGAGAGNNAP